MGRASEISSNVREDIISHHKSGKGYKSISKVTGVHLSTVRAIIRKWKAIGIIVNLPRSGRPAKISRSVEEKLILEVTQNPSITTKELQASLASTEVKVHGTTITRTLKALGFERASKTDGFTLKEAESCDSEIKTVKLCVKEEEESYGFEIETDDFCVKEEADSCDAETKTYQLRVKEEAESCDAAIETDKFCIKEEVEAYEIGIETNKFYVKEEAE